MIMNFFRSFINSIGRTLGRIITYILIGIALLLLFGSKVKAETIEGSNNVLSDTYYNLFSGYVSKLEYDENYVAFSYNCSSGSSYTQTCYELCYGPDLVYSNDAFIGTCKYVKYDYSDGSRVTTTGTDNSFHFSGDIYYSNLGYSSELKGGTTNYEKMVLLFIAIVICNYIISRLFFNR